MKLRWKCSIATVLLLLMTFAIMFLIKYFADNTILPSSPCVLAHFRDKREGRYYKFTISDFRIYAYSAIYDDRPSLMSHPLVRILAVSDDIKLLENRSTGLFCRLQYPGKIVRVELQRNLTPSGPGYPLNGKYAEAYVLSCPTTGENPHHVSIEGNYSSQAAVTSCMPIEYPVKPRNRQRFVVCVPVSYGNLSPYHLIEWIEMQRYLGADLISVYDLYLGEDALKVFRYYSENDGFVELRKMDQIYPWEGHAHILELAISLNDCLYRHMNEFDRLIVSDFDEFIKSKKHRNYTELVDYLETILNRSQNYIIRNNYYFLDLESDHRMPSYMNFLQHRLTVKVSPPFHRVKPIILINSCTHLFSHQCLGLTPTYFRQELFEQVEPDVAVNQHYRFCPSSESECAEAIASVSMDDTILIVKDLLITRVKDKILAIFGNIPNGL